LEFRRPSTASSREPTVRRVVQPPPRFRSRAFSTPQRFPSKHEFHGVSQPQPFLGLPPSERSPRSGRVDLSIPLAPSRSFTRVRERAVLGLIAAGFRDSDAHAPSPPSPVDYGLPFLGLSPASWSPWAANAKPLATAGFIRLEAFFPSRVRSRRRGSPLAAGRCSLGLSPLQRPSSTSDPRTRPNPRARARSPPEGSSQRPRGPKHSRRSTSTRVAR